MNRGRNLTIAAALVVLVVALGATYRFLGDKEPLPRSSPSAGEPSSPVVQNSPGPEPEPLPKKAYLRAACKMPAKWIKRIDRGWSAGTARNWDLVIVPKPPNYMGTFINTSHSAPYDFLQDVPLVLYGPGFVEPQGRVALEREVTIADLAPTYAELMGFDFPDRPASSLTEVLRQERAAPKLIFTAVIDGGGWNALERWPDAWPFLKSLIPKGVNVDDAIVGSSPSITPATHTNLSTGTFPKYHRVTAIAIRANDGAIVGSFSEDAGNPGAAAMDPNVSLRRTTLSDLWDRARNNRPKIGMLSAGNLQLGMVGHGSALRGGDRDIVAIKSGESWATNPQFYSLPGYVNSEVPGPQQDLDELDRSDGAADGRWRGHDIDSLSLEGTPAFAPWQNRTMQALIERQSFGADGVTDLFYVNYKSPDKAGHTWNMIAPEQEDVIRSVDDALRDMVAFLDETVGPDQYLFVVTADHGQTPLEAGGWALNRAEVVADINGRFDRVDDDRGILQRTSASSFFMNKEQMRGSDVTPEEVASFLSRYTIGDNVPDGEDPPAQFEERSGERIFTAVFPGRKLPRIVDCAGPEAQD